ncbi:hypothetical protein CY0110_06639 [Crocosphaera chwakensis CCY0110]|uniref:Uncharacterized protein n=1 Tax=Crocosphaera chwakensis CCY0110 TaxID=391612 RepID=A3IZ32_9CHRO|nr:hypothetical protein CY0110_06639 [Crocosphaera chwakensis CCY0110]
MNFCYNYLLHKLRKNLGDQTPEDTNQSENNRCYNNE